MGLNKSRVVTVRLMTDAKIDRSHLTSHITRGSRKKHKEAAGLQFDYSRLYVPVSSSDEVQFTILRHKLCFSYINMYVRTFPVEFKSYRESSVSLVFARLYRTSNIRLSSVVSSRYHMSSRSFSFFRSLLFL